jgi:hypothetical protein
MLEKYFKARKGCGVSAVELVVHPSDARHLESLPMVRHSNLTKTEVHARADPTAKLHAIEAVVPPSLRKAKFRPSDKLLALLKGNP